MDRIRLLRSTNHVQYSPLNVKPEHSTLSPSVSSGINMMDDDLEFIPSKKSKRSLCSCLFNCCRRYFQTGKQLKPRTVWIGKLKKAEHYPPNKICNQKYNILTFIPGVLYNQFKFFLNLYFLLMACSQFIPQLKIGYLYTYWAPLGFVLTVTLLREGWDEVKCYRRDKEINSAKYKRIDDSGGTRSIPSSDIKVSDVIMVEKDQRVPADLVLLQTTEKNGTCFIRTDQLDGETDWKLRIAVTHTQAVTSHAELFTHDAHVYAEKPRNDIHSFVGTFSMSGTDSDEDQQYVEESLNVENSLWANTVVASGCAVGVVVYTGRHTRSSMNTSNPSTKIGLLDMEINFLTKILFTAVIVLSFFLIAVKGFEGPWYQYMFRFVILFSYIIPISLRVNLDMGKTVYNWLIQHDVNIPDTIVRTSTIPEELGRINYLLSDKTGTLTQNDMIFKRLHMGTVSYGCETMDEVESHLKQAFVTSEKRAGDEQVGGLRLGGSTQQRRKEQVRIKRSAHEKTAIAVKALAICHNVTPVYESKAVTSPAQRDDADDVTTDETSFSSTDKTYQASSPDEVALVKWTETVGLSLEQRDLDMMQLRTPHGELIHFDILQVFPFTSESKRMGIIVRERATQQIVFYVKGADAVMTSIVQFNDWLGEECDNMAREGLRTLVVARKLMTDDVYADFERRYTQAKLSVTDRAARVAAVVETLERDMELLCLTGVEDKLQLNVKPTLEMLSNAGIKIWMLTGDKLETTICIAKSARLVSRDQSIHVFQEVSNRTESHLELNAFRRRASDTALIIRGSSLAACLRYYATELVELACQCPAVLVCRCSPTQKAQIVSLLRQHTGKRVCAIGDGGNDVSMIQAADCGIGIVGKEGKQASLAADFSLTQFCHLGPLLMVHGRNSYKRSAALSQFIIHRGLIISVMQAIFSSVFYFSSVSLYQGYLMVGYTTIFTMFPVFSLVLDQDVKEEVALRFPELYRELHKGRSLSLKTFLLWVLISIYQGGAIMYGALLLFDSDFTHIVSISFTALILTELVMVALTIRTWHWAMLLSEAGSLAIYALALFLLKDYFDETFLTSSAFLWRVVVITCATCLPLALLKYVRRRFSPPSYSKLEE